jgi:O-antigen/teichoic acid export membrane protein
MNPGTRTSAPDTPGAIAARVSRNSAVVLFAELSIRVISFVFLLYVARTLGVADFGQYTVAVNLVLIISVTYDAGLKSLILREVSHQRQASGRFYHNLLSVKAILGAGGLCLLMFVGSLVGYASTSLLFLLAIGIQFLDTSFDEFHASFFNAHEIRQYEMLLKAVQKLLMVAVGIAVLALGGDLLSFAVAIACGSVVSTLAGFALMSSRIARPGFAWEPSFIRHQLKEAWPFALSTIAIGLYFYVDSILVSRLAGAEAAGHYTAAYRLLEASLVIPFAFTGSVNPVLVRSFHESPERMKRILKFTLKILFILGFPLAVGGTILARPLILLLYGEAYAASADALRILVWAVLIIFLNTALSSTLNAMYRQRLWLAFLVTGAVFNIFLNLVFIPLYGFLAASAITVLTELLICVLMAVTLVRSGGMLEVFVNRAIVGSGLLMGLLCLAARDLPVLGVIGGAAVFYVLSLLVLKALTPEEVRLVAGVLPARLGQMLLRVSGTSFPQA